MTSATVMSPDEQRAGVNMSVASMPELAADMARAPEVAEAVHEVHLHLPTRIFGECAADHQRRGAPCWWDTPDVMPLGEEGGTAWTPDNLWLREEE